MSFPRTAKAAFAALAISLSPVIALKDAQAAPFTITLSGTIDATHTITGTGTLAGFFNVGDTFTLETIVDQDGPPDRINSSSSSTYQEWSTSFSSLSINGETFTIGDAVYGDNQTDAQTFSTYDWIEGYGRDTTSESSSPGSATSTLAGIDRVRLNWYLFDDDGQNDILDFSDPRIPTTIDLADWLTEGVYVTLEDFDTSSTARFSNQDSFVFSSVSTSGGGGEGVPAPGALALLGFGLIGLGFRQSRTKHERRRAA